METLSSVFVGSQAVGQVFGAADVPQAIGAVGSGAKAAVPATSGLFGSGGAMSWFGAAKGSLGLLSMISAGASGFAQAGQLDANAQLTELMMERDDLKSREEATKINQMLLERLSFNAARAGASGLLPTSGAFQNVDASVISDADQQLAVNRDNAEVRRVARRIQTRQYRAAGNSAIFSGLGNAATTALMFAAI